MQRIAIIDYGMGNLQSVNRNFSRIGANVIVTSDPLQLAIMDKVVLPGVGHFAKAMENLTSLGLIDALNKIIYNGTVPILGICLGMQLFAKSSEEGNVAGLGWIDAEVVRFKVNDTLRFKVPHMGWNGLAAVKENALLEGIGSDSEFYFVHSYHFECRDTADILCQTEYCYPFTSAVQKDNIYGVQFHPEKSHDAGEQMLRNFLAL